MNIFFVHTPFQLLVAQSLVLSKGLGRSVLVLGYSSSGEHFYQVYDRMILDEAWVSIVHIGDINVLKAPWRRPIASFLRASRFLARVKYLFTTFGVRAVYFGDINHYSYLMAAERYGSSIEVYFFEEGISHYMPGNLKGKLGLKNLLQFKEYIADLLFFRWLGLKGFARYLYSTKDVEFRFPIKAAYHSFPRFYRLHYKFVPLQIYLSAALRDSLDKEVPAPEDFTGKEVIVFLSTTLTELFDDPVRDEMAALDSFFMARSAADTAVVVKYHPKDDVDKKRRLREFLRGKGFAYFDFPEMGAVPFELILSRLQFSMMVSYVSSSMLYAQLLKPKSVVVSLVPSILEDYSRRNVRAARLEQIWQRFYQIHVDLLGVPVKSCFE